MSDNQNRFMTEPQAIAMLKRYAIPYPENAIATSPKQAGELAERIGYPVVLKIISVQVPHKSDAGGVMVNIMDKAGTEAGYTDLVNRVQKNRPDALIEGVLLCKQAEEGVELIIGGLDDVSIGPCLMFGLGGIFAEILKDVSFRSIPMTRLDAEEMVQEIKGYPMLTGARGKHPCDTGAIVDLLLSVARMMEENPQIKELDLNPVRVFPKGLTALDARILTSDAAPVK